MLLETGGACSGALHVALEHGGVDELVPDAAEHVLHFRCPRHCFVF